MVAKQGMAHNTTTAKTVREALTEVIATAADHGVPMDGVTVETLLADLERSLAGWDYDATNGAGCNLPRMGWTLTVAPVLPGSKRAAHTPAVPNTGTVVTMTRFIPAPSEKWVYRVAPVKVTP